MSKVTPIDEARQVLQRLLNSRVPARVNSGGHQTAVRFKEAVDKAKKALASQRSTLPSINAAIGALRAFQD